RASSTLSMRTRATSETSPLSLHDALPICKNRPLRRYRVTIGTVQHGNVPDKPVPNRHRGWEAAAVSVAQPEPGSGPTVRRILLGYQLRQLRESKGISRADAAYKIRGSESKISRVELGRVGFKIRDVEDLLTFYGVEDPAVRASFL